MRPRLRGLTTPIGHQAALANVHRPALPIDRGIAQLYQEDVNPSGHRGHATRTPPASTRTPGSESAGYHGDLSIPGYHPKTPTGTPPESQAAVTPAEIGTSTARRDYRVAVRHLPPPVRSVTLAALHNPLHPTERPAPIPTATEPAPFDLLLGQNAETTAKGRQLLDQIPSLALQNVEDENGQSTSLAEARREAASSPTLRYAIDQADARTARTLEPGIQTLAEMPTSGGRPAPAAVAQLVSNPAAPASTARISSQPNPLQTPEGKAIMQRLQQAHRQVANSGADLGALHEKFPELSLSTLRAYRAAERRTGVPPALLAGIEGQESDYGRSTLPGVRSGSNFAGASGPFQIGTGGGAAGDWWHEHMPAGASPYNDRTAAIAAGKYLTEAGATKDPSTWYDAALSYNHADWYAQKAVEIANEHRALNKVGLPPNPSAVEALHVAQKEAKAAGINPTPWNGDVEKGHGDTVYVRADAKGMVNWVKSALGAQEGSARQLNWAAHFGLGSSQPWCANLVSNGLVRRGVTDLPANPNYVPSYEEWAREGKAATDLGTNLAKAKPGDLIAYSGEHIGVYVGHGEVISGNFGNEVGEGPVSSGPAPVSMIIRPKYKGGRVAVHAGTPLPGSTSEEAFGGVGGAGETTTVAGTGPGGSTGGTTGGGQVGFAPALVSLESPFAGTGPVMPTLKVGEEEDPNAAALRENLTHLLGTEAGVRGRPYLPA